MRVRRALADEHVAIARLFTDSVRIVCRADYTDEELGVWAPEPIDLEPWRARITAAPPWVVEAAGAIVGFAELEADGHVDRFYVHHAHQRRGIGRLLIDRLVAEARRDGSGRLHTEASITARPFFAAMGFRQLRPNLVHRGGLTLKNYLMELPLAGG